MRIAFPYIFDDASWLGGRNYYASLFQAIEAAGASDIELVLVTGRTTATTLQDQFPRLQRLRTSMLERRTIGSITRRLRRAPYGGRKDPLLAGFLHQNGIDLSSHSAGLGGGQPVKSLGWIPDFQFMKFPDHWTPAELKSNLNTYRSACLSCDALIVSSNDALSDLRAFAPWSPAPAHVLHFTALPIQFDRMVDRSELLARYQLPDRYVHLPNQFWGHKNHAVVIDALAVLKQQGVDVTVACTGQTTDRRRPDFFGSLMARAEAAGVTSSFRILGLVPYADMQSMMLHANCVLNPSQFEGWSTTVEEAKALGKHVLLSDLKVHREQAPPGARYFAPDDHQALAALLMDAVNLPTPVVDRQDIIRRQLDAQVAFGKSYLEIVRQVMST